VTIEGLSAVGYPSVAIILKNAASSHAKSITMIKIHA